MMSGVGNVQFMQRINRVKVLDYIRRNSPVSRNELSEKTNLSLSSITNIVNFLLENKLVFEVGRLDAEGAGRRAALLEFNAAAMQIISVNIEPDEAQIALTDLNGVIVFSNRITIDKTQNASDILSSIEGEIAKINQKSTLIRAIGVSVSGHVTNGSGIVNSSIMRWKSVNIKKRMEHSFGMPVYVSNNSKTKALWKVNGYKELPEKNIVFLDLVQGVGIISFYEGKINEAVTGELGHTTVMKDGPQCFCGNHGCLELVCSEDYVLSRYSEKSSTANPSFEQLLKALEHRDENARSILRECAEYLGIGIANIISIFEPGLIIINGNRLTSCPFVYDTALEEANERGYNLMFKEVKFESVSITSQQALQGMSQYVADQLFDIHGPDNIL